MKAIERMKEGGFNLRKWKSSNVELLQEFKKSDPSYIASQEEEGTNAKETLGYIVEDGKTKVLGIPWDTAGDKFEFDLSKMEKCYVVLFVCCASRALHLDLIDDLLGPTFIRSLRRFTARRGTPDLINSDNAKTFKFTNKFLHKLASDHSVVAVLQSKRIN